MRRLLRNIAKLSVVAAIMFVPTWFLFGPVGGFHHHYAFGILRYMVWNGEDPAPRYFGLFGYEVWFSWPAFLISLLIWILVLSLVVFSVWRRLPAGLSQSAKQVR